MLEKLVKQYGKLPNFRPETFDDFQSDPSDVRIYDPTKPKTFYHSGDFGDIIYALPTIRALGGGVLYLGPEIVLPNVVTRQKFTKEISDIIAPLLELQPYVERVEFVNEMPDVDYDLNKFREYFIIQEELFKNGHRRLNLAETHLYSFRRDLAECTKAWIAVDSVTKIDGRPVVIHRSPRWRNSDFPWDKVLEKHGHQAVFVGMPEEHASFVKEYGTDVPYQPTKNFLELARIIAGCELFIGNQSAPYSVAEAMKINTLQEVWPEGPNCLFSRQNASYGEGKIVYIPNLKKTMINEVVDCPLCKSDAWVPFRNTADIVSCTACTCVYLRTRPTAGSMVEIYQTYADGESHMRLPKTIEEIRSSGLRREYFMDMVLKHATAPGVFVDVGSGWGAFLCNARDKGFTPRGIEIGHKSAEFATSVLGLNVTAEQLEDTALPDGVSVVSMIHVLEHLPHTDSAILKVHSTLKPGGLFCGIVPNIDSLCSRTLKDRWDWLDPRMHYTHFTVKTLRRALEDRGFKIAEISTHTGDYNRDAVAKLIQEQSQVPMQLDEIEFRLKEAWENNLGEEIRFFALKV